jgi:NhaP-type Na+/H+ or K+/H+ antiporter
MAHDAAFAIALALAAGIAVQCAARSIRVPGIVLLLTAGVALGPVGLNWVRPAALGEALFVVVDFAVAIILFEGALNLKLERLRREERAIRRLVTWGALVTLIGGALAARFWMAWSWPLSLLFGSLVVVTGPTVVGPLVRDLRLHPRLQTVLEAEGVLIDPIGALLAVLVFQITLSVDAAGVVGEFGALLGRLAIGALCGAAGGFVIAGLLRWPAVVHGYENALTLALVIFLFYASDLVLAPSGLVAVTVAGLVVGTLKTPVDDDLREFKDQLTVLMIGAVFILLAADVGLEDIRGLGWPGIAVLATLVLVVRPLGVWVATRGTTLTVRERAFVSAIAPRGIVAAAIASLTASTLSERALAGGFELRALVFLVIVGTVVAAGAAAWPLATLLRLRLPARDRVAILGAQGLGLTLGRILREAGQTVVFVDADPRRCRDAEEDGFQVVFGDGLQERTLRRIPIELVGTAIGVTFNDNLNSQFARLTRQTFGVPNTYVSVDALDGGRPPEHVSRNGAVVLFGRDHDQERWDVRWRQGDVEVVTVAWQGRAADSSPTDIENRPGKAERDSAVVMVLMRNERTSPYSMATEPREGDLAVAALDSSRRDTALASLRASGWQPAERSAIAEGAGVGPAVNAGGAPHQPIGRTE